MLKVQTLFILLFLNIFSFGETLDGFFDKSDRFLKANVVSGKVKYASVKSSPSLLNELVAEIGTTKLTGKSKNEKLAFYINSYNILVINAIVKSYPVNSPMDIAGFFDKKKHLIAGEYLTLNDLENKKVRIYKDARIHFALVCAAISCPKLYSKAYRPTTVSSYLQSQTVKALNDGNFIRVKPNSKTVYISEIFKWYKQDFVTSEQGIIDYINKYRTSKILADYEVKYYPYSWKLNKY